MEANSLLLQPVVQYGFLGFSVVLLGVVIWLVKRLLLVLESNTTVIAEHLTVTRELTRTVTDLMVLTRSLHDKLISRPCIAREENP